MKRLLLLVLLSCSVVVAANCPPKPPPPPPPPPPCQPVPDAEPIFRWESPNDLEITWDDMPVTVGGGNEACVLKRRVVTPEGLFGGPRKILFAYSFQAVDVGNLAEMLNVVYAKDGTPLYRRSEHVVNVNPEYDAFDPPQPVNYTTDGVIVDILCRVTGENADGKLEANCHLAQYLQFEADDTTLPCDIPPGEPSEPWGPPIDPSDRPSQMIEAHNAAKAVVGDRRGQDPHETLGLLEQALGGAGHCAEGPWGRQEGAGDELAIKAPDGLIEQFHSVGFTDGGYTARPYKAAWPWEGDVTPPECGPPLPPPAHEIKVRRHGGTPNGPIFDSTGLVKDFDYCTAVGFQGKGTCAVRPECSPGEPCPFPDRVACERLVFGTPAWKSDGQIVEIGNPWQRRIKNGTWVQVCTGPTITPEVCSARKTYSSATVWSEWNLQ